MKKTIFVLVFFVYISFMAFGANNADSRVMQILNQLGYDYNVDSDNDFRLVLDVGNGRTQLMFINSATNTSRGQEIREIWSIAATYNGSIPQSAAQKVLLDSYDKIIGSWYAIESSGTYYLAFCAKIPADANSTYMYAAIQAVVRGADAMEQILTNGGDDH